MIRINLMRDLPPGAPRAIAQFPRWVYGMAGLLLLLVLGCWWWAQVLENEKEALMAEREAVAMNLSRVRNTVDHLTRVTAQKAEWVRINEYVHASSPSTEHYVEFLKKMGESVDNLKVWLDAINIEGETIEIRGQSYEIGDVGRCLDRLENTMALRGIPLVEIQEDSQGSPGSYTFTIRMMVKGRSLS